MEIEVHPSKKIRLESLSPEISDVGEEKWNNDDIDINRLDKENVVYDPTAFIRCHGTGRNNRAPNETKTQVWDVAFEPDKIDPENTTTIVATCGGNSICFINVITSEVIMKYSHKERGENFYTLAWTLLPHENGDKKSILVAGSKKGEISMINPEDRECFYVWPFCRNIGEEEKDIKGWQKTAINSVVFHSINRTWLFVGLKNGVIFLYDIGSDLVLPNYSSVDPQELLRLEPHLGEIYNIIWTGSESQWLMAASESGMIGWKIDSEKVLDEENFYFPITVDFQMPKHEKDVSGIRSIVDSLDAINDFTIVSKCVMHGFLYVVDLAKTIQELEGFDRNIATRTEKEAKIIAKLEWSKTENFYMNMGCNRQGLICCGDDEGSIWVYEQKSLGKHLALEDLKYNEKEPDLIKANVRLMWPDLDDEHQEGQSEENTNKIMINKISVSHDSMYIVAVTSNNMVCVWKRQED